MQQTFLDMMNKQWQHLFSNLYLPVFKHQSIKKLGNTVQNIKKLGNTEIVYIKMFKFQVTKIKKETILSKDYTISKK